MTPSKIWLKIRGILHQINGVKTLNYAITIGTINGLFDLIAFSTFLPLFLYLINPESVENIAYLSQFQEWFIIEGEHIIFFIILLTSTVVLKNILSIYLVKTQLKLTYGIANQLAELLIKKYYKISYTEYLDKNSSELSKVVSQAPLSFSHNLIRPIQTIVSESILGIFISLFIFLASPFAFGISLVVVGVTSFFLWYFLKKKISELNNNFRKVFTIVSKHLYVAIENYLQIRLKKKSSVFIDKFLTKYTDNNHFHVKSEYYKIIPPKIFEILAVLVFGLVALLIFFGYLETKQVMFLLTVFSISLYRIIPIANKIITQSAIVKSNLHVLQLLEKEISPNKEDKWNGKEIPFTNEIKINNLSFAYKDQKVLDNVNVTIKKGDWVGIYGPSGCGKSTLMKLLIGVLKPQSGCISVDGVKLDDDLVSKWFEEISYLSQKPNIIDGSLAENITFGSLITTEAISKINALIDSVGLKEWVSEKVNGIDTIMGENGEKISGGQAKRISLARALFDDTKVLLLDEFTNETNPDSNAILLNYINDLNKNGKTIIQISHQPDSLKYCNKVFALDANGQLELQNKVNEKAV